MFLRHHSGAPSDHVMRYVRGKLVMQGMGLDFLYVPCFTKVVSVPTRSVDTRFSMSAWTSDYQRVRVEGEVVFRITSPKKAAASVDFTVKEERNSRTCGSATILKRRVLSAVRNIIADEVSGMSLRNSLVASSKLGRAVKVRANHSRLLSDMGVSVIGAHVRNIECTVEMTEALASEHLGLPLIGGQPADEAFVVDDPSGQTPVASNDRAASNGPTVECTSTCPFRFVCEDYMKDVKAGRAWCTLFREFSR
ncbi:MAG: SPFH domain-containing protein [Methanobacteriota archaeon]|nr:MAG: SPFH domain-containing protein [Euryarchaeota archaeon]